MAKQSFVEHKPGLESVLLNLAVSGLKGDGIAGETLRRGMRTQVSDIVNKPPFGMFPGLFESFIYKPAKAIQYAIRGGLGIVPKFLGELPIYDGDDAEVQAFKREFRIQVLAAQLGSRRAIEWLLDLQAKATQQ